MVILIKDLKPIIAKNISELRRANDITQADLAQKLNYSDKAVSKWERGESIPDITVLSEIADIFGVTVDYLISEEKTSPAELAESDMKILTKNRVIITIMSLFLVLLVSTFSCQFISNVPSAILLSQFTADYAPLLLGVNIGGTGTLIASLASLITFNEFRLLHPEQTKKYLLIFTGMNVAFLVVMTLAAKLFFV